MKLGEFIARLLGWSVKFGLPLMENVTEPFVKSVLLQLGLIITTSVADGRNTWNIIGSGSYDYKADSDTTTLISSNEEIQDVMKIVKFFKESRLLIKGVSETNEEESKEQKRWISKYVVKFNWCWFIRKSIASGRSKDNQKRTRSNKSWWRSGNNE